MLENQDSIRPEGFQPSLQIARIFERTLLLEHLTLYHTCLESGRRLTYPKPNADCGKHHHAYVLCRQALEPRGDVSEVLDFVEEVLNTVTQDAVFS